MHEILLIGGSALGSTLALWAARIRWMRRRRAGTLDLGERVRFGQMPMAGGGVLRDADLRHNAATVLVFMSNRCPGVKAYDARLRRLHDAYAKRGVQFVGVNPIDERNYPDEDLDGMAIARSQRQVPFVYVKDEGQRLAHRLGAICTPQVFVLDVDRRLRYRGRIDDAMLEPRVKVPYLANALDSILSGARVAQDETVPLGCSIEYSARSATRRRPAPDTAGARVERHGVAQLIP